MDECVLPSGLAVLEQHHWGAEQWALNILTLQLHTLQTTKRWLGPGNEAWVWASIAVRAGSARAATCGVEQWAWLTRSTLSNSLSLHLQTPLRPHLHVARTQDMMWICNPSYMYIQYYQCDTFPKEYQCQVGHWCGLLMK